MRKLWCGIKAKYKSTLWVHQTEDSTLKAVMETTTVPTKGFFCQEVAFIVCYGLACIVLNYLKRLITSKAKLL